MPISLKKLPFLLLVSLFFTLAGCLPLSQNPLSSPESATADPRLGGVWYGKSGGDEIFLHFVPSQTAQMQVVEVDHEKKGEAHTTLYTVFPTVLDGRHYLNIQEGKGKPYYLARYQLTDSGELSIWLMSEAAASKAIKKGKIQGKVVEKPGNDQTPLCDITITDSTKNLAAFVTKSSPELLFDQKFATFKKVPLPKINSDDSPTPVPSKKGNKKHSS